VTAIHCIERTDNVRKTDKQKNEWESGFWPVTEETAKKLIGAFLHLHRSRSQSSHFGGRILSYRLETGGPRAGLVVFVVRATADCKDVKVDSRGWSKDCKILWDVQQPVPA
jgi:hypothetical protein